LEVRVLPPEPMAEPSSPRAAPKAAPLSAGRGCLIWLVGFPIVVLLGIVIGTVLSGDDEPAEEDRVTLDEGTIGTTEWRVDAERDVEGDTCAFLYEDGQQLTGACTLTPQDASFGEQTVVFGKAADDAETVRVELDTGDVVEIDTTEADGIDGRFYVQVVDGDVDAERLAVP